MRDVVDQPIQGALNTTYYSTSGAVTNFKSTPTVPGYRAKGRADIQKGDHVRPEAYSAYRYNVSGGRFFQEWMYPYYPYTRQSLTDGRVTFTVGKSLLGFKNGWEPNVPQWVINKATANAIANLQGGNLDLGQALAEMPESVKTLSDLVVKVAKAFHAARQGKYRKALKEAGITKSDIGDNWLSFNFGIRPVLSDLFNAQEAIKNALSKKNGTFHRAKGFSETQINYTSGTTIIPPVTAGCEVGILYSIEDSRIAGLASLGLTNPLSIAWELTRMSFLIDWFMPIGDFLKGLSGFHGVEYLGGYQTTFTRCNGSVKKHNSSHQLDGGWVSWSVDAFSMKRLQLLTEPQPGVSIKLSLNLNQAISAIALVNQRI